MAGSIEFWTDQIQETGVVIRVYFHVLVQDDAGNKTWHFFGTDADTTEIVGPNADEPRVQHDYVQFPQAWQDLPGDELNPAIYGIALRCGLHREGLE